MNFFKQLVIHFYQNSALYLVKKTKPIVIGVTGSAGKSTAVSAIASTLQVLLPNVDISYSKKQYNGEIGLPLSLFEIQESGSSIKTHLKNMYQIIKDLIVRKNRPKIYVLEYGVDYPQEMKKLTSIVKPDFSLFTGIGTVHFGDRNKTLQAKWPLAEYTKRAVITNIDSIYDEKIEQLGCDYFSIGDEGNINIQSPTIEEHEGKRVQKSNIVIGEETYSITTNSLDKHIHIGIGAGIVFSQIISHQYHYSINNLHSLYIDIKQAPGRFNMLSGINDSIIIDSSYNSSPLSFSESFDQFLSIKNEFFPDYEAWVMIGDMRELYEHEVQAHKDLCPLMIDANISKYFLVGEVMTNIVYNGLKGRGIKESDIFCNSMSNDLGKILHTEITNCNSKVIVFVKGSQNTILLEEGIKQVLSNSEDFQQLCRQSESWIAKKKQLGYISNK